MMGLNVFPLAQHCWIKVLFIVWVLVPLRVIHVWYLHRKKRYLKNLSCHERKIRTTIILGSGGHTSEMLKLLQHFRCLKKWSLTFLMDKMEDQSLNALKKSCVLSEDSSIEKFTRCRQVGQSYVQCIYPFVSACWESLLFLYKKQPDLILCNGPGTCIPLCLMCRLGEYTTAQLTKLILSLNTALMTSVYFWVVFVLCHLIYAVHSEHSSHESHLTGEPILAGDDFGNVSSRHSDVHEIRQDTPKNLTDKSTLHRIKRNRKRKQLDGVSSGIHPYVHNFHKFINLIIDDGAAITFDLTERDSMADELYSWLRDDPEKVSGNKTVVPTLSKHELHERENETNVHLVNDTAPSPLLKPEHEMMFEEDIIKLFDTPVDDTMEEEVKFLDLDNPKNSANIETGCHPSKMKGDGTKNSETFSCSAYNERHEKKINGDNWTDKDKSRQHVSIVFLSKRLMGYTTKMNHFLTSCIDSTEYNFQKPPALDGVSQIEDFSQLRPIELIRLAEFINLTIPLTKLIITMTKDYRRQLIHPQLRSPNKFSALPLEERCSKETSLELTREIHRIGNNTLGSNRLEKYKNLFAMEFCPSMRNFIYNSNDVKDSDENNKSSKKGSEASFFIKFVINNLELYEEPNPIVNKMVRKLFLDKMLKKYPAYKTKEIEERIQKINTDSRNLTNLKTSEYIPLDKLFQELKYNQDMRLFNQLFFDGIECHRLTRLLRKIYKTEYKRHQYQKQFFYIVVPETPTRNPRSVAVTDPSANLHTTQDQTSDDQDKRTIRLRKHSKGRDVILIPKVSVLHYNGSIVTGSELENIKTSAVFSKKFPLNQTVLSSYVMKSLENKISKFKNFDKIVNNSRISPVYVTLNKTSSLQNNKLKLVTPAVPKGTETELTKTLTFTQLSDPLSTYLDKKKLLNDKENKDSTMVQQPTTQHLLSTNSVKSHPTNDTPSVATFLNGSTFGPLNGTHLENEKSSTQRVPPSPMHPSTTGISVSKNQTTSSTASTVIQPSSATHNLTQATKDLVTSFTSSFATTHLSEKSNATKDSKSSLVSSSPQTENTSSTTTYHKGETSPLPDVGVQKLPRNLAELDDPSTVLTSTFFQEPKKFSGESMDQMLDSNQSDATTETIDMGILFISQHPNKDNVLIGNKTIQDNYMNRSFAGHQQHNLKESVEMISFIDYTQTFNIFDDKIQGTVSQPDYLKNVSLVQPLSQDSENNDHLKDPNTESQNQVISPSTARNLSHTKKNVPPTRSPRSLNDGINGSKMHNVPSYNDGVPSPLPASSNRIVQQQRILFDDTQAANQWNGNSFNDGLQQDCRANDDRNDGNGDSQQVIQRDPFPEIDPGVKAAPRQQWTAAAPRQQWTTAAPRQQWTTAAPRQQWTTAAPRQQWTTAAPRQQWTTAPPQQQPTTVAPRQQWTTAAPRQQWTTAAPRQQWTTAAPRQQWTTAAPRQQWTTAAPRQQWTTAAPRQQWTTAAPRQQWTTAAPRQQWTTAAPRQQWTTAAPRQQWTTAAPRQQWTTAAPRQQWTTAAPRQQWTTAAPRQQWTTAAPRQQWTTAAPRQQWTTAAPQQQPITLAPRQQWTTAAPCQQWTTAGAPQQWTTRNSWDPSAKLPCQTHAAEVPPCQRSGSQSLSPQGGEVKNPCFSIGGNVEATEQLSLATIKLTDDLREAINKKLQVPSGSEDGNESNDDETNGSGIGGAPGVVKVSGILV